MLGRLLALFIIVPFVELAILVWLGGFIGFWPTIGLVLVTGTAGALLAKTQGAGVVRNIRVEMAVGRVPTSNLLDGLLVLVGGLLLLTPGLLSDLLGIFLLVPQGRRVVRGALRRRIETMIRSGEVRISTITPGM